MSRSATPTHRLHHCAVGDRITLADGRTKTIATITPPYACFTDGAKASLCYPAAPHCMVFGDGDGWRPKETQL